MSGASDNQTASLKKDPAWKYCHQDDPKNKDAVTCNFCGHVKNGGISRMKQHFVGGFRNAKACGKIPEHVKVEIKEYLSQKKKQKDERTNLLDFDDATYYETGDEEDDQEVRGRRVASKSNLSSWASSRPREKGPIDSYFTPDPEEVVQSKKGKQKSIVDALRNDAHKKELRDRTCRHIAAWMYDAGIPFNAVKYDSFKVMIEAIGQYGPGMKAPSYHEVRVPLLKKEVEHTKDVMKDHKIHWASHGCSIMANGWTDKRQRTLINFLVNCPKGSMFIESVDASSYSKTGEKMCELISKFIEHIGPSNVVQVVTDSASNMFLQVIH